MSACDGGGGSAVPAATSASRYCRGCNTRWYPNCCGTAEADWHARCPHPCAICGLPITGRTAPDACGGHTLAEHDALMARLRGRVAT